MWLGGDSLGVSASPRESILAEALHGAVVMAMDCFSEPAAPRARQRLSLCVAQLLIMAMAWCSRG